MSLKKPEHKKKNLKNITPAFCDIMCPLHIPHMTSPWPFSSVVVEIFQIQEWLISDIAI